MWLLGYSGLYLYLLEQTLVLPPSGVWTFCPPGFSFSSLLAHRFLEIELLAVCPPVDSNWTPHWARFCSGRAGSPRPERGQDLRVLPVSLIDGRAGPGFKFYFQQLNNKDMTQFLK